MHTWSWRVRWGLSTGHPALCAHSSSFARAAGSGCRASRAGLPCLNMPALAAAISCGIVLVHVRRCKCGLLANDSCQYFCQISAGIDCQQSCKRRQGQGIPAEKESCASLQFLQGQQAVGSSQPHAGRQQTCSESPRALWCSKPMAVMMASFRVAGVNMLVASLAPPSPASTMATSTCKEQCLSGL